MLYSTGGRVNDAINAFGWEAATLEFIHDDYRVTFVQCAEVPEGLLVCIGEDTNLPSSTLRLARGNVDIDLSTKKIQITDSDGVVAIVREATDKEATATWAYIGNYSPDDLAFMKKHADYFYTVQANQSE